METPYLKASRPCLFTITTNRYLLLKGVFALSLSLQACGGSEHAIPPEDAAEPVVLAKPQELQEGRVLAGSYIVTFRTAAEGPAQIYFPSFAAEHQHHYANLSDRYLADPRIKDIQFLTATNLADPGDTAWLNEISAPPTLRWGVNDPKAAKPIGAIARVDFTDSEAAQLLLQEWRQDGSIWFAEPNYLSRLSQTDTQADTATNSEDLFSKLAVDYGKLNYWWLKAIGIEKAFQSIAARNLSVAGTPTDADIQAAKPIIAVLDSGIDYLHPALKDRIWVNDDMNAAGCKNDAHGCNTTVAKRGQLGNGDVWPYDTQGPGESCNGRDPNCSHGTHVAGIIAADSSWGDTQLSQPTAGICPVCRIMVVKIVSKVGKESGILDSSIIAGFKYVSLFRREGNSAVRVVNASFGKFSRSRAVGLLVRLMKEKRGTLVVGAAGNEDTLAMEFPAAFNDAIAVAAVDQNLRKVSFSNFGRWVDISAPGSNILSTVPGEGVDTKSGTSMATPMVSALAGLMIARYPGISFDELRSAILNGADASFYARDYEDGFNYNFYYPKIPQESTRQPLLGLGVMNANNTIERTTSGNLPVYSSMNRVRRGCGVIYGGVKYRDIKHSGGVRASASQLPSQSVPGQWTWLYGLIPAFFSVIHSRRDHKR